MAPERVTGKRRDAMPLDESPCTSKAVSLHLVPTAPTRQLLNGDLLALVRPDSLLVNTAGSALIDFAARVKALAGRQPGSATLHLFNAELYRPTIRCAAQPVCGLGRT